MAKQATRDAYGKALAEFGGDERIIVLDADLSKSTKTCTFKDKYPERHINMGIAEGNMMGVAAGIASTDKIVFASSFAVFASGRAFEQVRNSICYPKLNVKIAATHAGITVGEDGASHQSVVDVALMRSLPNMTVLCPADAAETRACIKWAIDKKGPFYIRLGRLAVEDVYESDTEFKFGKGKLVKDYGNDVVIFATGGSVRISMDALDLLKEKGINGKVIDICSIKPIDDKIITEYAKKCEKIVTVEEHSIIGGLGSAVCEVLSEKYPKNVLRIGMMDEFGKSGTPSALLRKFGLDSQGVAEKVSEIFN